MQYAAELTLNARATPLIHAPVCRSSHAAAPEPLGDMQRPPWHKIIDEQTCVDPTAANMKASVMSIWLSHAEWRAKSMRCAIAYIAFSAKPIRT